MLISPRKTLEHEEENVSYPGTRNAFVFNKLPTSPAAQFLFLLPCLKLDPHHHALWGPANQFTRGSDQDQMTGHVQQWHSQARSPGTQAFENYDDKFSSVAGGQLRRLAGLFPKWIPGQPKYDSCLTPAQGDELRWKGKWVQPNLIPLSERRRERDRYIWLHFELPLYCVWRAVFLSWGRSSQIRGKEVTFWKKRQLVIIEQIRKSPKKPEAWLEPLACVITVSQTEILSECSSPKLPFHLSSHQQASAQRQLSLISAITEDLEAGARKGARGFVFFIGNLQLQGPVPLNPLGGTEEAEEQASFSSKETKGLIRKQTRRAHEYPSSGSSQK